MTQKQYQISCECGNYHWAKQKKMNQDLYRCTKCGLIMTITAKNRNSYLYKDNQVFKKKR